MPSASPQYTFSSVFREAETPLVLNHSGGIQEPSNNGSTSDIGSSNNTFSSATVKGSSLVNNINPCTISTTSNSDGSRYTYDPFKCLTAMAEQSLRGNFTHTSSISCTNDGTISINRVNNTRDNSSSGIATTTSNNNNNRDSSSSSIATTTSNNNNNSAFITLDQSMHYLPCDKNVYLSLSSNSSVSSSHSPPLSPSSSSHCMYTSSPNRVTSNGLDSPGLHRTNEDQSNDFLRNDRQFSQSSPANHNAASGCLVTSSRPISKKSYPSCSSEQSLDEGDWLLSWTLQHPEGWSCSEVLDWVFFVAQELGLDMQEFRGENFQAYTGAQLCQMGLEDFTMLEPNYGKVMYGMFRKLLCGVLFQKPIDPGQLNSSGAQMSSYSPAASPKLDMKCFPQHLYQVSTSQTGDCNGVTQNSFFKQERCSNMDNSGIDITSYDFDLDDTPCLPTSQSADHYQPEFGMYPAQYHPPTAIRASCCFPAPHFPGQLPRRRPGRPRVKSLMDDDRVCKEKKVKNQHLWEFIYETLMNPMYNPQFLRWENQRDGVFRFVQSEAVAQLWGGRKNNENMTYEKLSRAMRHYYRRGILERVEGRRLVYKFSLKAMERIRDKRNSV